MSVAWLNLAMFAGLSAGRAGDAGGVLDQFAPRQVDEVELSAPDPLRPRDDPEGRPYASARILFRLHSYPIGIVEVAMPPGGLDPEKLMDAARAELAPEIHAHLAADGLPPDGDLTAAFGDPPCQADRREILADPPLLSVLVPTRDRPHIVKRCVDSILACEYPRERRELIVVDNVPSDARTRELVQAEYGDDETVRYIVSERPGSAAARNDGAAVAVGEIIACTDDDVLADRHWLTELVRGFRNRPDVACVTGLVVAAEMDTPAQDLFEQYGGFGKGFRRGLFDVAANRPAEFLFPYNSGTLGSGNNVAFRRTELLAAGGYDPELGNGTAARAGEDLEIFLRILRRRRAVAYEPGALVWHWHRREIEALEAQIHDYGVGIGAYLTRTVLHDPRALLEIAARVPRGAWYLLSSDSPPNRGRGAEFPRSMRMAELRGVARGPLAYLRSRRQARRRW